MRVFTCTNFQGHWPVGSAAVIVAEDKEAATDILYAALINIGLGKDVPSRWVLEELPLESSGAVILCDGNY